MKSIMMRNMMMLMKMGKEAMANTSRDITCLFVIGTVQEAKSTNRTLSKYCWWG